MHRPNWNSIWIIGAGRFGQLAGQRICKAWPQCAVTLVDSKPMHLENGLCNQIRWVHADGIRFLAEALNGKDDPDWIVPAAPVHVAYEWIRSKLALQFAFETVTIPRSAADRLPNPQPGKAGTLYFSNATWVCPDDCPEPVESCTVTGEAHTCIVYRTLEELQIKGFETVVIRSWQLLPGVGGYTPDALAAALDRVRAAKVQLLLSTACRCHGVMDAFRLISLKG